MAKKPWIQIDVTGLRDLEKALTRDFGKDLDKWSVEANKAADRETTPEAKARAFAKVMKRHGVDMNVRELTKEFKGLMSE